MSLQLGIKKGDPKAIAVAVRVLEHQANISPKTTALEPPVSVKKESPQENRAKPNDAIIDLFQDALQVLIDCGAVPRNYDQIAPRQPKLIEVTASSETAEPRDSAADRKERK